MIQPNSIRGSVTIRFIRVWGKTCAYPLYTDDCIGRDDLTARQGYYIQALSAEEAWERMAIRYPEETSIGFTVQDWEGFNVVIKEVKRDC